MSDKQRITGNAERVRRYRTKHRRIDYVPAADVARIIEDCQKRYPTYCLADIIDRLIRAGHKAVSGNAGGSLVTDQ